MASIERVLSKRVTFAQGPFGLYRCFCRRIPREKVPTLILVGENRQKGAALNQLSEKPVLACDEVRQSCPRELRYVDDGPTPRTMASHFTATWKIRFGWKDTFRLAQRLTFFP